MSKLIAAYRKAPTMSNRRRLQTYLARHPFAVCMATAEELEFLRVHEFAAE